ncbi:MAG: peptidoglycan DD-metalloendopeptidase family protein [Thioalkalivibrio sp.]|nr:peptidoglycan DD-metalloendopeptidase family protein [Thioalkalivibrio sp.]
MQRGAVQRLLAALTPVVLAGLLTGCVARAPVGSPPPDVHVVQRDETLYRIAQRYGQEWRDLAERNAIGPPYLIYPGQRLRLRGAARSLPPRGPSTPSTPTARSERSTPRSPGEPASDSTSVSPAPAASTAAWRWPADGDVLRRFSSGGTRKGLAIGGERGDAVRAARSGEVVYAGGGLVGYGRMIILKHDAKFLSAYGHNEELLVTEGDQVEAGETIARMGSSGAERPMLHFEIRVDGTPVDPAGYLPDR